MNDLVMIIKKERILSAKNNKVEEFKLSIDLAATGATKSIGGLLSCWTVFLPAQIGNWWNLVTTLLSKSLQPEQ
ncbi:hypothetical protein NXW09_28060 [Bacteroides ovatus]|nr:hypothetical protein [Bacteroides ovatus]